MFFVILLVPSLLAVACVTATSFTDGGRPIASLAALNLIVVYSYAGYGDRPIAAILIAVWILAQALLSTMAFFICIRRRSPLGVVVFPTMAFLLLGLGLKVLHAV